MTATFPLLSRVVAGRHTSPDEASINQESLTNLKED